MKKIVGILLIILAIAMIYIGFAYKMVPPALTGVGFIGIALVFLLKNKGQG